MTVVLLCKCFACGQTVAWLSMDDVMDWGDSHHLPRLVGRAYVRDLNEFGGVVML